MSKYYREKNAYPFMEHGFDEPFKKRKPELLKVEEAKYKPHSRNLTSKAAHATFDNRSKKGYIALDGNTYKSYLEYRKNS